MNQHEPRSAPQPPPLKIQSPPHSGSTLPQPRAPQQPLPQHPHRQAAETRLVERQGDARFVRERAEMKKTDDLKQVDDDVEAAATLFEWHAQEHEHHPKSPVWFATLAAGATVIVVILLIMANFIGAITTALLGGLLYYIAQQRPSTVRYRIMVDGVALNTTLYHYQDLQSFNIVYEPGEVKTVILRSRRRFTPFVHMEIGDADPVEIREILLEFLPEDQNLQEPLVDIVARRLGF